MTFLCCSCKRDCTVLALIASLIIGVVAAFLQITAVITVTPAFLWVVLGIAVVYLAVTLLAATFIQRETACRALCSTVSTLLLGILGTVLFAVILLAVTFAATSVIGAIVVGLLLFFVSLLLTSTACLVNCLINCDN